MHRPWLTLSQSSRGTARSRREPVEASTQTSEVLSPPHALEELRTALHQPTMRQPDRLACAVPGCRALAEMPETVKRQMEVWQGQATAAARTRASHQSQADSRDRKWRRQAGDQV